MIGSYAPFLNLIPKFAPFFEAKFIAILIADSRSRNYQSS